MINLDQAKITEFLKKSENLLVIAILLMGLIIVLKVNAKNVKIMNRLKQEINTQNSIDNAISDVEDLEKDYKDYRERVFFDKDSSEVVNLINSWARGSAVDIISLRPSALREVEPFLYIPLQIEAQGDYFSFGKFLGQIESYEGFIEINDLRISSLNTRQGVKDDKVKIALGLNAIILKELDTERLIFKR